NVSTVLKIIGIYGLLILLLSLGKRHIFESSIPVTELFSSSSASGFNWAKAFVGVLWSYTGWHYASFVTGVAINPKRNVPIAMIAGTLIVTLSYVLCNIGYLSVLSVDEIKGTTTLAADAAGRVFPGGDIAVSVLIALSVFGCAGIYVLATPRIIQQMSTEGLFFEIFGKAHPKFGVPVNAILLQSAWAIVLVFYWGKFESLYTYVTITEWFFLLMACAGLFIVRYKKKSDTGEIAFKSPLFPLLPIIFIAVIGWFIVKNAKSENPAAYYGLLIIPVGAIVYYLYKVFGKKAIR
ncbi:MAG: amino acid permease, partial [Crocinitomicaceae bacterium]|nr:amino acid permease [Crocinitomicaceae bacterium]